MTRKFDLEGEKKKTVLFSPLGTYALIASFVAVKLYSLAKPRGRLLSPSTNWKPHCGMKSTDPRFCTIPRPEKVEEESMQPAWCGLCKVPLQPSSMDPDQKGPGKIRKPSKTFKNSA